MSVAQPDPRPRAPRWMRLALFGSLALNVLVVGAVTASIWKIRYALASAEGFSGNLIGFAHTLPPERRSAIRAIVAAHGPVLRPLRLAVRQARREAARLLVAEPFDRGSFATAHTRVIEAEGKVRQASVELVAEVAAKLSAEERRAFLSWRSLRRPGARRLTRDRDQLPAEAQPPAAPK